MYTSIIKTVWKLEGMFYSKFLFQFKFSQIMNLYFKCSKKLKYSTIHLVMQWNHKSRAICIFHYICRVRKKDRNAYITEFLTVKCCGIQKNWLKNDEIALRANNDFDIWWQFHFFSLLQKKSISCRKCDSWIHYHLFSLYKMHV